MYDNFSRVPVELVEAGDICALTGLADVAIGETICAREAPNPLPTIKARPCVRGLDYARVISGSGCAYLTIRLCVGSKYI